MRGWIAVDFDGTLAKYDKWEGPTVIGEPIPKMVNRVKRWLSEGRDVRIFTARVYSDGTAARDVEAHMARLAIVDWCVKHLGREIPITNVKDYRMMELWDDRAVQVLHNTGLQMGVSPCKLDRPEDDAIDDRQEFQ